MVTDVEFDVAILCHDLKSNTGVGLSWLIHIEVECILIGFRPSYPQPHNLRSGTLHFVCSNMMGTNGVVLYSIGLKFSSQLIILHDLFDGRVHGVVLIGYVLKGHVPKVMCFTMCMACTPLFITMCSGILIVYCAFHVFDTPYSTLPITVLSLTFSSCKVFGPTSMRA